MHGRALKTAKCRGGNGGGGEYASDQFGVTLERSYSRIKTQHVNF